MELAWFGHRVEWSREVANAQRAWGAREFTVLTLRDGEHTGFGEVSPLPGYVPESMAAARAALTAPALSTAIREADALARGGSPPWAALRPLRNTGPTSTRHGVELALLDLWARRADLPLAELLSVGREAAWSEVGLARLWDRAAPAAELDEVGTWKVKLGVDAHAELDRLESRLAALAGRPRLRFDANRAIPAAQLPAVLARLAALGAEFVEEPATCWPEASPVALAWDETLRDFAELRDEGLPAVFVLKPMVLGIGHALELAAFARWAGLAVVWSHCFDGPVAWRGALSLALSGAGRGVDPADPPARRVMITRGGPPTPAAPLARVGPWLEHRPDQGLGPHSGLRGWPKRPFSEYQVDVGRGWRESGLGVEMDFLAGMAPLGQVQVP